MEMMILTKSKIKCIECGNALTKTTKVFAKPGENWCRSCIEKEEKRLHKQDYLGGYKYSRPPKYMLDSSEWAKFGY